ncbi:MAG: hypothetical protein HXY48_12195 [Ignavibacteriaceae bacterium]|jgi:hypothetical protein|nr:hypothetical protein [Ignavibacteriaceae bacterium]
MITQSTDTNPEVERVLVSLLRKLTIKEKLNRTLQFSSSIINLSKRAIARANPELSEDEKKLLFVEYHYGAELANKLRLFKEQTRLDEYRDKPSY